MENNYDVIIVGAGHAGVEAAYVCAKRNNKVGLINLSSEKIASMPCNPSIGGPAKGNIVREIDALGGIMGKAADATYLQMKLLNYSRGPAVQALRAQIDKIEYSKYMANVIKNEKNIDLIIGLVKKLIIVDNKVKGVILNNNKKIYSKVVILTTGTYMASLTFIGHNFTKSGPDGDKTSNLLSQQLKKYGFKFIRLKTGTSARIKKDTINFNIPEIFKEPGTNQKLSFSYLNKRFIPINEQAMCWLTHSNKNTHKIVNDNLNKSVMYSNRKNGKGPRYCPSFEDKIVRFKDKERHQIFLEPESVLLDTIYIQGFSTSMPKNIQLKMIKSLKGFENCKILKWAYAIEYDSISSLDLKHTLETKILSNLYTAGQINGTSGYEEAACQGLIAGINASLKLQKKEPFILKRSEGYIGVLIDDIVTKDLTEPYRMLTSRAEYRLLLRNDNAEERLKEKGYKLGLISQDEWKIFKEHQKNLKIVINDLKKFLIKENSELGIEFNTKKITKINNYIYAYDLLKRPNIELSLLEEKINSIKKLDEFQKQTLLINIKFEGYVKKQIKDVERFIKLEKKQIPNDINYDDVDNIANEAREKLKKIRPISIGQATRILGINPSDIQMLLYYLKKKYKSS